MVYISTDSQEKEFFEIKSKNEILLQLWRQKSRCPHFPPIFDEISINMHRNVKKIFAWVSLVIETTTFNGANTVGMAH